MKINKEDYKKLNQLDRIEFMLRDNRLEKKYDNIMTFGSINAFVSILMPFVIITFIALLGYNLGAISFDLIIRLFTVFKYAVLICAMLFVIECGINIILLMQRTKDRKELYNDFFNIQIKTRRK